MHLQFCTEGMPLQLQLGNRRHTDQGRTPCQKLLDKTTVAVSCASRGRWPARFVEVPIYVLRFSLSRNAVDLLHGGVRASIQIPAPKFKVNKIDGMGSEDIPGCTSSASPHPLRFDRIMSYACQGMRGLCQVLLHGSQTGKSRSTKLQPGPLNPHAQIPLLLDNHTQLKTWMYMHASIDVCIQASIYIYIYISIYIYTQGIALD